MLIWLIPVTVFVLAYLINIVYISIFYHRALAHGSVTLRPWLRRFVIVSGVWVTGIDPKAWACMHRKHHLESDTEDDPHSPAHYGLFGTFLGQLRSYEKNLVGLMMGRKRYTSIVADMEFPVSWLFKRKLWFAPYLVHLIVAVGLGMLVHNPWLSVAYFLGMMSHPLQGWMVNAICHSTGYRNFNLEDNSRNNTLVALVTLGEGFQNNHHQDPARAKFSVKFWEIDMGYWVCRVMRLFGLLKIGRPAASAGRGY